MGLQGVLTRPALIDTAQKRDICGVDFLPGGASAFHQIPATNFTDRIVAAESFWGTGVKEALVRLRQNADPVARLGVLEIFLLSELRQRPEEDRLLQDITMQIARGGTI